MENDTRPDNSASLCWEGLKNIKFSNICWIASGLVWYRVQQRPCCLSSIHLTIQVRFLRISSNAWRVYHLVNAKQSKNAWLKREKLTSKEVRWGPQSLYQRWQRKVWWFSRPTRCSDFVILARTEASRPKIYLIDGSSAALAVRQFHYMLRISQNVLLSLTAWQFLRVQAWARHSSHEEHFATWSSQWDCTFTVLLIWITLVALVSFESIACVTDRTVPFYCSHSLHLRMYCGVYCV